MRFFCTLLIGLFLTSCHAGTLAPTPPATSKPPPRPLQMLFIGDPALEESAQIATDYARLLGPTGIHLTYVADTSKVDSTLLENFDFVSIYTNYADARRTAMMSDKGSNENPRTLLSVQASPRNLPFIVSKPDHLNPYGRHFYVNWNPAVSPTPLNDTLLIESLAGLAGDSLVARWKAGAPAPLAYITPEVPIPRYEDPTDPPLKQLPLTPEQSLAYTQVPPGFEAQLFAAEPDIVNPVAMSWDERGRLWVIETLDYPNNKLPLGEGNDSIKILEDTDGDGRADSVKVFADGLSIATGFTFANDGVIVSAPPEMLFLKDTDGDDVADEQTVLFDGFLTFDTHAGVSNLRYGFDNWIWMSIGYAGFEGIVGNEEHRFKQGLLRLKPDISSLDYLSHFSNNTWGLGFSENGDVFASTANNEHSAYLAIPDRYFAGVNGFDKSGYTPIAPYKKFHPITDKVRQADVFGGYTAATGHALYTARQYPEAYWNRIAFINEPTGHLVHKAVIEQQGTQFVAKDGWNQVASADEWASPVMAEIGPDGALWVLDWYNLIIQHNPVPEGFVAGDGDAYETPLRDQKHGRIYRVVYKDAPAYAPLTLSKDDPDGLIQALQDSNLFWRLTAQRLLVERGNTDVMPDLLKLVENKSMDAAGINGGAVHALWTLKGLGALDGSNPAATQKARQALVHPAPGVRRAAIQVLPPTSALWMMIATFNLLEDEDPLVTLHTLLKISQLPTSDVIGKTLYALQDQPRFSGDPWLPTALAIAAAKHHNGYLNALMEDAAANIQREVIPVDAPNLGFEVAADDLPAGWGVEPFVWPLEETNPNVYTHEIVPEGRTGNALKISSPTGADVGVYVDVPVKPNTTYLLTGWIKTENLENMGGGYGAVIDILTFGRTRTIRGTSDWTWVERRFNTGPKEEIRIQCHLGRWGQYKGTAWFDDLRLVELGDISPSAVVAETVFRHIGAGGLDQAALSVLEQLNNTTPAIRDLALSSFAENWPTGQRPAAAADDNAYRTMLADKLDAPQKNALEKLLQRWRGETVPIEEPRTAGRTVLLQTELNTLKFAQDTLTVQAGEEITLVFENLDAMPHNVVIGMPGTLETIGGAADALARTGQGAEQAYVPTIESVLTASPLVDAGKSVSFTIQVPTTPGDYPFICTFPGHWRIMNGILRVE